MSLRTMTTAARTVVVGADHGGYELKELLLAHLGAVHNETVEVVDVGFGAERCDYPDVASAVGERVAAAGDAATTCGMVVCGTGIGISIAANKVPGIRAALCHDHYTAAMARQHNDANVLALGGRVTGAEVAKDIVDTFLATAFEGGRHATRVGKIMALEPES